MIQRINTVSFGNSPITELKKVQDKRDEIIEGALGTGGAVAVANGNKVIKAVSGITQKTTKSVAQVSKNSRGVQNFLMRSFESAEAIGGLKWMARLAKSPVARGFGKAFGGIAAVGFCATDISNMINTFGGNKFPTLSNFGNN